MAQAQKSVFDRVREQAAKGKLGDDVTIVYQVRGGAPGQRHSESVVLSGSGKARVTLKDELKDGPEADVLEKVDRQVALDVYRLMDAGTECLIPASEARFLPDSMVGSISVGIGDEKETFYFDADEEACTHEGRTMPVEVRAIRDRFNDIERVSLAKFKASRKD